MLQLQQCNWLSGPAKPTTRRATPATAAAAAAATVGYLRRVYNVRIACTLHRTWTAKSRPKSDTANPHGVARNLSWDAGAWGDGRSARRIQLFADAYLYNLIPLQPPRNTRSSSVVTLARPPTHSSLKITSRSFRYASPHLWNQFPTHFVSHVLIYLFLTHHTSMIISPHQRHHHHSCHPSPHHSFIPI